MAFESTKVIITAKDDTQQAFNSVVAGLGKIKNIAGGLGLAVGLNEALDFAKAVTRSTIEAEQASAKITATLKATGFSAGVTKAELDDLAESLARSTQFDDDGIRNAEAAFLKFGNIQEGVFKRGISLATDLAALMGTDIESAAQTIGKALSAPGEGTGALEKQIGKLTKAQQDSIDAFVEQGNLASAQSAILDVLQGKIGGTANEMNTGLTKSTKDLSKAWDDMLESFGKTELFRVTATTSLGFITDAINGVDIDKLVKISNQLNKPATAAKPGFDSAGKFNIGSDFPLSMNDEGFKAKLGAAKKLEQEQSDAAFAKNKEAAEKSQKAAEAAAKAEANRVNTFLDSLKKQAATLNLNKVEVLQYEAAQLRLSKQQRAVVDGAIAQIDAFEKNAEVMKNQGFIDGLKKQAETIELTKQELLEYEAAQLKLNATQKQSAQLAITEIGRYERIKEEADRQKDLLVSFQSFSEQLKSENEDLNVNLISSDKKRAKAQLDLEHERAVQRINDLKLEGSQAQELLDREAANYDLRVKELAGRSSDGLNDILRALDGFSQNAAQSFADFTFGAETDFSDMVNSILKDLSRLAIQKSITDPVSDYFASAFEGFGTDFFGGFFADGGRPPLGKASIVGERGPELFVPDAAGTILPNDFAFSGGGGDQYSVSVMVDATGGSVAGDGAKANDLGRQIEAAVRGVLLKEKRQGGILS
jgi:hypothetical protein